MSGARVDWERLNAYVDGELDPRSRAEIAAAVAARPDLAAQVAMLTRLKAATDETLEAVAWDDVVPKRASLWRERPWRRMAAAAVLLGAIAIAAAAIDWRGEDNRVAWLMPPIAAHDAWVASGAPGLADGGAGAILVGFAALGADVEIPDLSAGRLTISGVNLVVAERDRPPAVHVAYSGTRGCRVTLWITPAPDGLGSALTLYESARPYRVYGWRAGDFAYALVSGVDPARLEVIARTAHKVTLDRVQPDVEMATALRRSRAESPPCPA